MLACRLKTSTSRRLLLPALLAGGAAVVLVGSAAAESNAPPRHWPQWRGPAGSGAAPDGAYPDRLAPESNLRWKTRLPGLGASTPAVWGDLIVLTCAVDGRNAVCCYDYEGELQWQRLLGPARPGKHRNASASNPSPVTDGRHVVVYFKSGELAALDLAGEVVWQRNLQEEYGEDTLWWDLGTSPVLADGKVIVAVMQAGESYLLAVELATGDNAWRTPRQYERPPESDQAYTTPQVVEFAGQQAVVTWGADHVTCHAVATGDLLWETGGFNPNNEGMWRVIASAVVADDLVVVPYGRGRFVAAVRLGALASEGVAEFAWQLRGVGSDVPTPAAIGPHVYVLTDDGELLRVDRETGAELDRLALPRSRAKFYASPSLAGQYLYAAREDGAVFTVSIAGDLELVHEADLGEQVLATPAPVGGEVLIRGSEHLYLFGP
jgi:outer membrane protein assembly factor BamB